MVSERQSTRTEADHQRLRSLFFLARDGNEQAFRELHDALSRPLMAYCLSFTRDLESAKDLFQQVMTNVFEKRDQFRDGNFSAWVFTIARNACRTWEMKSRRFVAIDDVDQLSAEDPRGLDSDEIALVQSAILDLPDEFRTVILLRYFGDMSVADIAEAEDISVSLVKIRLFRARQRLTTRLGPLLGYSV